MNVSEPFGQSPVPPCITSSGTGRAKIGNMPGFAVDTHPQKQKIIDGILAGKSTRHIADTLQPPVSFAAIQRYKSSVIKPMVREAESLNRVLRANKDGEIVSKPAPVPMSSDTEATQTVQRAIEHAPALSIFRERLEKVYGRIDKTLDRAETAVRVTTDKEGNQVVIGQDLGPLAPLYNVALKALETHGRATGELEPQGAGQVSIQIVLPRTGDQTEEPRISFASQNTIELAAAPEVVDDGIVEIGVLQKP